jgi:hypothetical protein
VVFGESPLKVPEKAPVPLLRFSTEAERVGFVVVPQTIPRADMFAPPSALIFPLTIAEVEVMEVAGLVVNDASAAPVHTGKPSGDKDISWPGNPGASLVQELPFQYSILPFWFPVPGRGAKSTQLGVSGIPSFTWILFSVLLKISKPLAGFEMALRCNVVKRGSNTPLAVSWMSSTAD